MLATGSRLGPYEILTLPGAGGMGEVYGARETRLTCPHRTRSAPLRSPLSFGTSGRCTAKEVLRHSQS